MLDDHRIARQLFAKGRTSYDVQTLPFDEKYAPRLIAPYAAGGFSPNADGHADTWTPQFDITKPLKSAELSILDSTGKTVRKLMATAPDGSIRDLSWDGRTSKGVKLPVGAYQWKLSGRADDGDGTLLDPWGRASVQGTVEIDAV
jgi:gliding motility-associated-like protein